MAPPAAASVIIVTVVAGTAAALAFKEFVWEPYLAPRVEQWAEDFLARRRARRRTLTQPIRQSASSSSFYRDRDFDRTHRDSGYDGNGGAGGDREKVGGGFEDWSAHGHGHGHSTGVSLNPWSAGTNTSIRPGGGQHDSLDPFVAASRAAASAIDKEGDGLLLRRRTGMPPNAEVEMVHVAKPVRLIDIDESEPTHVVFDANDSNANSDSDADIGGAFRSPPMTARSHSFVSVAPTAACVPNPFLEPQQQQQPAPTQSMPIPSLSPDRLASLDHPLAPIAPIVSLTPPFSPTRSHSVVNAPTPVSQLQSGGSQTAWGTAEDDGFSLGTLSDEEDEFAGAFLPSTTANASASANINANSSASARQVDELEVTDDHLLASSSSSSSSGGSLDGLDETESESGDEGRTGYASSVAESWASVGSAAERSVRGTRVL